MDKAIIIGGSAGSFRTVVNILHAFHFPLSFPIFLCLHRLKNVRSGFVEALSIQASIPIKEPFDKEVILPGTAYLAPANYHMLIENYQTISLSTEPPVHHARPSIDLAFLTAARAYRNHLIGVLLSGANQDGALGISKIKELGGITIVQEPASCEVKTMPEAALKLLDPDFVLSPEQIVNFLTNLT
ncbi:MAG TPA: chemotaxis protein CheB [Bacteroidales bacterium]|nr:chemotaxis protein CheB [Bacteroidales bacterium]HQK37698.1 chemotaxis protein CheB [Bacteroidales bacterium]